MSEVRARVCARARGLDGWSVARRRRAAEGDLRFARSSGADGQAVAVQLEAELPEWRRIETLLESSTAATAAWYDPGSDPVALVAAEEMHRREQAAADAVEAARRAERERRDAALRRAEDLLELAQAGKLDASVPVEADDPHAGSWPDAPG
ncbi:hypothetical protein [Streptomyces sp. NPDC050546]|uniref:hypothetical protein n=1 Tax=Streptomyces sp. NPDC050546 TaxID=3365628 RepID=UPI00378836A8